MSVFRPTYKDRKTGETKTAAQWWYEFTFASKRSRVAFDQFLKGDQTKPDGGAP